MPPPLPPNRRRNRAITALTLNIGFCPGLGTWISGQKILGGAQMIIAFAGFSLIVTWFVLLIGDTLREFQSQPARGGWSAFGWTGLALFALAWVWSLVSGLRIIKAAKTNQATAEK